MLEALAAKSRERIDRPREAAMRAGEVEKFLVADLAALRPFADALRGLIGEAIDDADLMAALRAEIWIPRAAALRVALGRAFPDEARRNATAEAIEGALLQRLLFGEPLDEAFARAMAALCSRDR